MGGKLMDVDIYTIIEACGFCCLALWLIGFPVLLVAVKKGRGEFRVKGYLKTPSGPKWLLFLLRKGYAGFKDRRTRSLFEFCRFCTILALFVMGAVFALVGCELLFYLVGAAMP
jgi:hypothetical protein